MCVILKIKTGVLMRRLLFIFIFCMLLVSVCGCGSVETSTTTTSDESSQKYSVGAYYSTKRDKVYIYFDENTNTAYWGSKRGSSIHSFKYSGSIFDKENGATDTSSNCIYIIQGNAIKKTRSDGSKIQSYSIIGYDVAMHKDLK